MVSGIRGRGLFDHIGKKSDLSGTTGESICGNPSVALPTAILARNPGVNPDIERNETEPASLLTQYSYFL